MATYDEKHRSRDRVFYAYFWVRILDSRGAAGMAPLAADVNEIMRPTIVDSQPDREKAVASGQPEGAPPFSAVHAQPAEIMRIVIDKSLSGQESKPGSAFGLEVAHYVFDRSFDKSRYHVTMFQMPPGTDKATAANWIFTPEGKAWAGAAFCFLGHTSIQTG